MHSLKSASDNRADRSTLSRFYKSVMALRDARVAKINEFLAAISLVKSNAWEEVFVSSIREQRKLELVSLLKYEPLHNISATHLFIPAAFHSDL